STVRAEVPWYIPASHQCPYQLSDVEHSGNQIFRPPTVRLNRLMDNNIKPSWPRRIP
ncbi:hypothetical protein A2U01_0067866, partial [Trifolium medium]|nr:hypothetical protein [Trifolium medium]